MCFSASASFASAAVLSVIGMVALKKAKTNNSKAFAVVPFLFAIQQFSEGFVWLSLQNPGWESFKLISLFTFLSFAQVVWPVWITYSIFKLESNTRLKNYLSALLGAGIVLSSFYAFSLVTYPVSAVIENHHIKYVLEYPVVLFTIGNLLYGIVTILPTFLSSNRRMRVLGTCISLSYIATTIFYNAYVTSVWCYFAALISGIIYWILNTTPSLSFKTSVLKPM